MPVSIKGTGGGSVTLDAGAAAADTTLTLPNVTGTVLQSGTAVTAAQGGTGLTSPGTAGNVLTSNGTGWVSSAGGAPAPSAIGQIPFSTDGSTYTATQKITQGTSASASGTSIDFTSIPSWVKRVTVMLAGVTTPAGAVATIRIGSGGTPVSSGYVGANSGTANTGTAVIALSTGFTLIDTGTAASICAISGLITLDRITGNTWTASSVMGVNSTTFTTLGGYVALGAALDVVRLTTTAGSASFTAGTVNILYE